MTQEYKIHENGDVPYLVKITGNNVVVFCNNTHSDIFSCEAKEIFIGKSPLNIMTRMCQEYGSHLDGNSILIKTDENIYKFIGSGMFTFESVGNIVSYFSPIGPNDVPYPYAIDEFGNIYFMIEDCILINYHGLFDKIKMEYDDPYSYFYSLPFGKISKKNRVSKEYARLKLLTMRENNQKSIFDSFYVGDKITDFRYSSTPNSDFEKLCKKSTDGKLYILYVNSSKKKQLTKNKYLRIMKFLRENAMVVSLR